MNYANYGLIEMRKLAGTRSGKGILSAMVLLAVGGAVISIGVPATIPTLSVADAYALTVAPLVLFIPISIMVIFTSEWSTHASLLTFTLTPRRGRVLAGKAIVGAAFSVAAPLCTLALAAITTEIAGLFSGRDVSYAGVLGFDGGVLQNIILISVYTAFAVAVAMLIRVTAAAVTAFLALTLFPDAILGMVLGHSSDWAAPIRGFEKLSSGHFASSVEIGQAGTVMLLWLVLPLLFGAYRFFRADIA